MTPLQRSAALALFARVVRASRRLPVADAGRRVVANAKSLHQYYQAPKFDARRDELLRGAAADAALLEKLVLQPRPIVDLLFRKGDVLPPDHRTAHVGDAIRKAGV